MRPKAELLIAMINAPNRVDNDYLTSRDRSIDQQLTMLIVITHSEMLNIVFNDEVETLIAKLTSRPKAEMLMTVNAEAEGRGINKRLTSKPSQ